MSDVKRFWQERAADQSVSDAEVTHRDVWQRWLEIESIKPYLRRDDRLLDVGCGTGYTTRALAPCVRETLGVDFSDAMIERARRGAAGIPALRFEVADVLSLDAGRFGTFDAALSVRCLINLTSWEQQQRALSNVASVLRPGGRLILVEGLADGRRALNALRVEHGLEEMPVVWHNVDFDERELLRFLDRDFAVADRRHFGLYDFIARIVHPLAVRPEAPRYDAPINAAAAQLALRHQEFGALSRIVFLVLERRG